MKMSGYGWAALFLFVAFGHTSTAIRAYQDGLDFSIVSSCICAGLFSLGYAAYAIAEDL